MRAVSRRRQPIDLLLGVYRRRVLALLLLNGDRSFYVREIARLSRIPPGSLHRELKALAQAGLLVRSTLGNQVRYQADPACPILKDVAAILRKSGGRPGTVREGATPAAAGYGAATGRPGADGGAAALQMVAARHAEIAELCGRFHVRRLDLFGSATRGTFDPARSDLDFVVIFENLHPVALADAWFGLREGLAALFGLPVDLLTDRSIKNPYLRESIEKSRRTLYAA